MNNNDYLTHHGIMGMKWGVRRYQNKDGTLTSAGKSRKSRTYTDRDRKRDKFNYGKRTQKRIEKKVVEEGKSKTVARGQEYAKRVLLTLTVYDITSGGRMRKSIGKKFANSYAKGKARRATTKITQNPYFNPIDVAYKILN